MNIAYLTTDDVNGALAALFAGHAGMNLSLAAPYRPAHLDRADGIVLDLDYLPAGTVARLLDGTHDVQAVRRPIAVHGYNIDDGRADQLRNRGVAVFRRLDVNVFTTLRDFAYDKTVVAAEPVTLVDRTGPVSLAWSGD